MPKILDCNKCGSERPVVELVGMLSRKFIVEHDLHKNLHPNTVLIECNNLINQSINQINIDFIYNINHEK